MTKSLLIINAGSSSIKFSTFKLGASLQLVEELKGQVDGIQLAPHFKVINAQGKVLVDSSLAQDKANVHKACLTLICSWLKQYLGDISGITAIGHRVVHGGVKFSAPVIITSAILSELEQLIPLAPLHQPHNLSAIRAFSEILPDAPQIACFDTAFHHTQPKLAQQCALPRHFFAEGVRRYGFHGLSYEYIASILPTLDEKLNDVRVIVAHLGNGASLCALNHGLSVATTMGFSPLDGLVMGTRCGNLDPGVILYLLDHYHMDAKAIENMLYHESGLLGVSAISSDIRQLLASADNTAKEAIELFVYRIAREIGSLAVAIGGLDALIFTGGIGEHSPVIRADVCRQLAWLGLDICPQANQTLTQRISLPNSKISAWVVPTNENLMIALHTAQLISKVTGN